MSFELKRKETVPDGMRRIVREQLEKGMKVLDGSPRAPVRDEAVHEARKRFKETRGAVRLASEELGRKQFDRENRTFRDAGRPLSEVRDAKVMIDTLNQLAKHYKGQLTPRSFAKLHAALESRRKEVRKRVLVKEHATGKIVRDVRKALRRVEDWPLRRQGWKAIADGLATIYQKGRAAMEAALRDGSDEALHEWRKRSKDLRYGLELLARSWPEAVTPLADSAHQLTDLLGEDHDLAVLQQIVESEFKDVDADEERELLRPLISQRRADLLKEARELGRKLFAETDGQFIDRLHAYWKAWR